MNRKQINIGHLNDITKIMETEKACQASLDKYRKMFDHFEDGLAEVDLKGNITYANTGAAKIWAGLVERGIGLNFRSYLDEETAKAVTQAYRKVYKTGVPAKFSYEIIRRDGIRRFIEDSISLIRDQENKVTGFLVVTRDINQRKEVERSLAEHRTRLEAIFSSVKDAIITVDPQLRVIEANKSTEKICGIVANKIAGQIFTQCLSQCNQLCCDVLRITLEKKSTIKEFRIDCGYSGREQVVNVTSSPLLDPEGSFMGAVMVIRDITILRNMERELRGRHQFHNIIGQSKKMQEIYDLAKDLADLETTVLITGESGTGKELVARAIHYSGRRVFNPFVAVNCSALTESLLESELFGHVKGAFTGAIKNREGRFQAANGGTILLDEIGDISPLIQLKLLRVLQEKVFERVGESAERKVDVRIIACTNRDLKEKVKKGEFREDLYYRLKVVEVSIPPLRNRLEDIPLLVDHFQKIFNERCHKSIEKIDQEVLSSFMDYSWPGNIRELEHIIEHAFVLCRKDVITLDDLPTEFREHIQAQRTPSLEASGTASNDSGKIREALIRSAGNKAKAARILGISRQAIYRKIYQYQINARM